MKYPAKDRIEFEKQTGTCFFCHAPFKPLQTSYGLIRTYDCPSGCYRLQREHRLFQSLGKKIKRAFQ